MNPPGPLSPPISHNEWSSTDRSAGSGAAPSPPQQHPHYPPGKQPIPPHVAAAGDFGRRNLATPPVSGSMNGYAYPPPSPGGPNSTRRGPGSSAGGHPDYRGNPSPPSSVAARSSSGTQVSVDAQRRKQELIETMLAQSHGVLRRHLGGQGGGPPGTVIGPDGRPGRRPNKARHKLVQLTPMQFQELSKDVCDELLRRGRHDAWRRNNGPPPQEPPKFLPPMEDIHPKRNQARQTLSELPDERFMTLATDTFFEIERRVPRIVGGEIGRGGSPANGMRGPPPPGGPMRPSSRDQMRGGRPPPRQNSLGGQVLAGGAEGEHGGRPVPKSSQANTMVPNKSYLVEDDDEGGDQDSIYGLARRHTGASSSSQNKLLAEYQEKVTGLESKVEEMNRQLQEKDGRIQRMEDEHKEHESAGQEHRRAADEFSSLRSDLEAKLANAQALNDNLQHELDRLQEQHGARERDLTRQLGLLTAQGDEGNEWRARHDELHSGHQELQSRHRDLENENDTLQRELDAQRNTADDVRAELAGFVADLRELSARTDQGRDREDALRRQIKALEGSLRAAQASNSSSTIIQPPSVDEPDRFLRPDGLVASAHVADFQHAIDTLLRTAHGPEPVKLAPHIREAVVAVKAVCDDAARSNDAAKPRARVAATANNFVTAAQNFAYAPRVSPVSLLDAAASHLAASVVGLVGAVGMRADGVAASAPSATKAPNETAAPAALQPQPTTTAKHAPSTSQGSYIDEDDEDDGGFDMGAYDEEPHSRYPSSMNGRNNSDDNRTSKSESVYSRATAVPAQAGHARKLSSAASGHGRGRSSVSVMNGRGPAAGAAMGGGMGYDLREQDEEIAELKHFLDEQSSSLTDSIQALVTSIRTAAAPALIDAHVGRIADAAAHILRTLQDGLDAAHHSGGPSAPGAPLHAALEAQISALAGGKARLLAAADEAHDARGEGEWREMVKGWPPVAFEIARALRELGAKLDEIAGGGGDDDFR